MIFSNIHEKFAPIQRLYRAIVVVDNGCKCSELHFRQFNWALSAQTT